MKMMRYKGTSLSHSKDMAAHKERGGAPNQKVLKSNQSPRMDTQNHSSITQLSTPRTQSDSQYKLGSNESKKGIQLYASSQSTPNFERSSMKDKEAAGEQTWQLPEAIKN